MTRAVDETTHVDELRLLEAEAVHIIREVVAELERPVLLFSAGKDSIVLLRLAEKAFRPRSGELKGLTGVDAPYEPPEDADLVLDTAGANTEELAAQVIALLDKRSQRPLSR